MGEKCDVYYFDLGMFVGATQAGFSISVTAEPLGLSGTTITRVYSAWCNKEKGSPNLNR